MTPEETAEDIMDQVWIHTDSGMQYDGGAAINLIAQAIREEREACAKIAEQDGWAPDVAAAIRSRARST